MRRLELVEDGLGGGQARLRPGGCQGSRHRGSQSGDTACAGKREKSSNCTKIKSDLRSGGAREGGDVGDAAVGLEGLVLGGEGALGGVGPGGHHEPLHLPF